MTKRHSVFLTALSLSGVLASAAAPAFAGPPGHPFERKPVPAAPAPNAAPKGQAQATSCNCMMMKGATAMSDQCMAMMSGPRTPSQPGAPG